MYQPYTIKVPMTLKDGSTSPYAGQEFTISNYYEPTEMKKRQNDKMCRLVDECNYNLDGTPRKNKQCYFITLTYCDDCLPHYDEANDKYYFGVDSEYVDEFTGEISSVSTTFPNSVCSKDVQDFLKRLRNRYCKGDENRTLRYYCTEEYGHDKRRAHYHFLFYPSHYISCTDFKDIVDRSWAVKVSPAEYKKIQNKNLTIRRASNRRKLFTEFSGKKTHRHTFGTVMRYFASMGRIDCQVPKGQEAVSLYVAKYVTKPADVHKKGAAKCRCFGSQGLGTGYCNNPENRQYHLTGSIDDMADRYRHPLKGRDKDKYPSLPKSYRQLMYNIKQRQDIIKSLIDRGKIQGALTAESVDKEKLFNDVDFDAKITNNLEARDIYNRAVAIENHDANMQSSIHDDIEKFYNSVKDFD